jgi:hypothetical protein
MFWISTAKRVFVALCLLGLAFIEVQGTTPAKMLKKEVKFQKVQEKRYDQRIGPIAFGSTIVEGKEKVYPKVIVFGDEVQFLNEKGEIVTRKSLVVTKPKEAGKYFGKRAILSAKGNFVAIYEYTGVWGDPINYKIEEKFTICNDRGDEIYNVNGIVEGKGEKDRWLISDKDGSILGTRIEYGAIDYYSPNGEVKTIKFSDEPAWLRRSANIALSGDGEYIALLVHEWEKPKHKTLNIEVDLNIILFNKTGKELFQRRIDEQLPGNISISDKGEYIIFKAYSYKGRVHKRKGEARELGTLTISLYDKEGNEISFKDTSLFTYGGFRFSPNADYVALAGDNLIWLMRTKDGSTIFKRELPKNRRIRDILFTDDVEYLIVKTETPVGIEEIGAGHITFYSESVFLFNMQGDKVWQKNFSDLEKISSQNEFLIFSFPQRYEIYQESE